MKSIKETIQNLLDGGGAIGIWKDGNGHIILKSRPKRKVTKTSYLQHETQNRFSQATQYAKAQLRNPDMHALYRDRITAKKKSAYVVAMGDFLTPPQVQEIQTSNYRGVPGDVVDIHAVDDFKVVCVKVIIRDRNGKVLEEGRACEPGTNRYWKYYAKVENPDLAGSKIEVMAFDYPGNKGTRETMLFAQSPNHPTTKL